MNTLTTEDIRHFIYDRSVDDNELEMDLFFSEDEIKRAMRFAAVSLNSIPPRTLMLRPERMPLHPATIHCTIYHLYLSKISSLSRNDIDYSAGDVTADVVKRQLANLKELLQYHKNLYVEAAESIKNEININHAYGIFC